MMAQYFELKAQARDCLLFYRMGDFFELFHDDAKVASAVLDIALTARGTHQGAPVPMCGVPVHAAEAYLARLIKAGHRVAIAEQVETPEAAKARGGAKALVACDIIRFVTAGTLTEEALLEARTSNWLVAVCEVGGKIGLAAADISTGRFELVELGADALDAELARLSAGEIIAPEGFVRAGATLRPRADFDTQRAAEKLATLFASADFTRNELAAAGGLMAYLEHVGRGRLPFLSAPLSRTGTGHMAIDAATRASLELTRTPEGARKGSLLDNLDRTLTGAGARLLAADLSAPLCDTDAIMARLDLVGHYAGDSLARAGLRAELKALPDIARALGRLVAERGSPRDLGALRDGLGQARLLRERLGQAAYPPALLCALLPALEGHGALVAQFKRALVETPPLDPKDGGFIAPGYDAALDELRALSSDGRRALAALEAQLRARTNVPTLKIRHNNVLGYHIEVPAKSADPLMKADSGFTH
ncbi:MAG: DNA mismatch repair protein MutS, partial [Alphaproteobacteria bacterium]|nr:DNA mismatch repair protein MutS [Alphaproteobacteria bacterium]